MFVRFFLILIFSVNLLAAQSGYWQQHADYVMDIDFDVSNHQFKGKQELTYTNNSPDTLDKIYYHLYFNAFQPGSMMDERSRSIPDPDQRIGKRIANLKEDEIGYNQILWIKQDGNEVGFEVSGTILKVKLSKPLYPGESTILRMEFKGQVPLQIRRSGRNNIEGIDYSMAQWYPKLVEYDEQGWHATPYISREFHGVWGNFNVNISLDSSYTIAATGVLKNADEIGKGYAKKTTESSNQKLTWQFEAKNVHDFVWAADRDYIHTKTQMTGGPEIHFFYQNDSNIIANWQALPAYTVRCFELMNEMVGKYPYSVYSVIQGGDGGMEYPMATLILGTGELNGLISVMVHESIHSWFQGVLASDEGSYPWMDEGFNTYFDHLVMDSLFHKNPPYPHFGSYLSYFKLLENGEYEAISMHADHYKLNRAYGVAAYSMGCILLNQLQYIIGTEAFDRTIHRYYNTWKFKHPTPSDFKRIAEKESGIELDWYFNYFIYSTRKIDFGISDLTKEGKNSVLKLERIGDFPMPVDVTIELKDGHLIHYTIPLRMMLKGKENDGKLSFILASEWPWTNRTYELALPYAKKDIEHVEIDISRRMADVNRSNNVYPPSKKD